MGVRDGIEEGYSKTVPGIDLTVWVSGSAETKLGRDEVWSYLRLAALAGSNDQTPSTTQAIRRTGGPVPSRTNADTQQPVSAAAPRGRRRLPFNGRLADAGRPARSKQSPAPGKAAPRRGGGGAGRGSGS